MPKILGPGVKAPEFNLNTSVNEKISLTDFRGKPLVIAFYPADWSPVCSSEMVLFNEVLSEFRKYQADFVGISVDGHWCHAAFAKDHHLNFPLLSDFEPKGEIAKKYGVYRDQEGISERALFLVDKHGDIAWSYLSPIAENPGADGVLEALEKLRK